MSYGMTILTLVYLSVLATFFVVGFINARRENREGGASRQTGYRPRRLSHLHGSSN